MSDTVRKLAYLARHEPVLHWHNWRMRRNSLARARHARIIVAMGDALLARWPESLPPDTDSATPITADQQ